MVLTDLTEHKRNQEIVSELERGRRMSDIGQLAATIAHEIRNPLAAISLAAYNLKRKNKNPLLGSHLETINKKVLEGNDIINNLLSFTRIKSVSYEAISICAVMKDCITSVSSKYIHWKAALKESLECGKDDIIEADLTQFKMLVSNILDNAYQALSDETGTVSVAVRKSNDKEWELAISDTGTGIDKKDMKKIFEPFYTTKSKGTGLGLAVCHEIVDRHHGKIDIQSIKGKGTKFIITLPVSQTLTLGA